MAKKEPRLDQDIHVKLSRQSIASMKSFARAAGLPLATWARIKLLEAAKLL